MEKASWIAVFATFAFLVYGQPVDVCVIGGGSSGTFLAYQAAKKGLTTALFESTGKVGGHCSDFTIPGSPLPPINTGVRLLQNDPERLILNTYTELGLNSTLLGVTASTSSGSSINFATLQSVMPDPGAEDVRDTVKRFSQYVNTNYPFVEELTIPDFSSNNPNAQELLGPFTDFISSNGFEDIRLALEFIISFGGGDPKRITTYHALQYANPRILPVLIRGVTLDDVGIDDPPLFYSPLGGCSLVYQSMAVTIGTVHLNTEVLRVRRFNKPRLDGAMNVVRFKKGKTMGTTRCRTTTIAFPQSRRETEAVIKLNDEEEDVFSATEFGASYYSGVFRASGVLNNGFPGLVLNNRELVNGKLAVPSLPTHLSMSGGGSDPNGDSYIVPNYCFDGLSGISLAEAQENTKNVFMSLEPVYSNLSGTAINFNDEPEVFFEHKFGLRFANPKDLKEGIYDKLFNLQGQSGGIYYTGALLSQPNQLAVWRYSNQVLEMIEQKLLES